MNLHRILAAAGAVSMLCTSPCLAATDSGDGRVVEQRVGAFAGVGVRLPLGSARAVEPVARLRLGMTRHDQVVGAPARMTFWRSALELGWLESKPMLFVGGQSTKALKQRARLQGDGTWLYVVGGLAIAGAAFLLLADDGTNAEPCIPGNC